jgi:hypothetical protein
MLNVVLAYLALVEAQSRPAEAVTASDGGRQGPGGTEGHQDRRPLGRYFNTGSPRHELGETITQPKRGRE